jgi:RHS repeat-associated protein
MRGRSSHLVAVSLFVSLLVQVNAEGALAMESAVDSPSLSSVFSKLLDWAKDDPDPPHGPVQQQGSAEGKSHRADAKETRAGVGRGNPTGKGKGELGKARRLARELHPFSTGLGKGRKDAFDESTSRRRPQLSTGTTDVFEDAEGRQQRRIAAGRVNYEDRDGNFEPVDTNLKRVGSRYEQKANSLEVDLAARADDPALATLGLDDDHSISESLKGAAAVAPMVSGSTATYSEALPATDVELVTGPNGVKETLVLKSPDAATSWVFPLTLQGLTAQLTKGGGIEYLDADGDVRAVTPPGFMVDSNRDTPAREGERSNAVTYKLVTVEGKPALKVSADSAWVKSAVFPVRVDPSTFADSSDTYVDAAGPAADRSNETNIAMGASGGGHIDRGFMKFGSLGNPPAGQRVVFASLNLFLIHTNQPDCTAQNFEVRPIRASWAASTTTTYPGPTLGAAIGNATPTVTTATCNNSALDPAVGQWVSVTLDPATFNTWTSGNYGLALRAPSDAGSSSWKRFTSANAPSNIPYLTLGYADNVAPQIDQESPETGDNLTSLRPELLAVGHDPDAFPAASVQYLFRVYDASGASLASSGLQSAGSWVVPAGLLKWGTTYRWTVQAYDGYVYSTPPYGGSPFNITVAQPLVTSGLTQNDQAEFDPNIGNYTTTETDLDVQTAGPSLSVDRAYNSRDPRLSGAFGAGWSSVYDMTVTETKDPRDANNVSGVVVTYPSGEQVGFGRYVEPGTGTVSFVAPPGRFATLAATTSPAGYALTDKAGTRYAFTQALAGGGGYRISSVTDAVGRAQTYTYTGAALTKATSGSSGRSLTFGWSTPAGASAAHVATVTTDRAVAADPASAQTWTYSYTGDQLTKVCPPTSSTACLTYAHTAGSHYLTTALDADPQAYWRLNDPAGTIAADAVTGNQGLFDATVANVGLGAVAGPLTTGATKSGTFNGTSSVLTVPGNDLVAGAASMTAGMWFKTSTANAVLLGYHVTALPAATTTALYIPALYIGSDGKLYGQLGTGAPATTVMRSPGAVTDNQWHFAALTADGTNQKLYLDGIAVATLAKAAFFGDIPAVTIGAGYIGGAWPNQSHYSTSVTTGYASYFTGQIAEAALYDRPLTAGELSTLNSQARTGASVLSSITEPSGKTRTAIAYDAARDSVSQLTDNNGGTWQIGAPTVAGSSLALRSAVLKAAPLGYWRMAERVATQAVDQVGSAFGDYDNVVLGNAAGPFGAADASAATFDGTTSDMRSPVNLTNGRAYQSLAVWFKTTGTLGVLYSHSAQPISNATTTGAYVPALYIGAGRLYGQFQLTSGAISPIATPQTVNDGNWHFAVLSGNGTTQTLYLDGAAVGSLAGQIGASGTPYNTFGSGFLGGTWPNQPHTGSVGYRHPFAGQLAEAAVYGAGLSADQVAIQWTAYANAKTAAPVKRVQVTEPGSNVTTYSFDALAGDRPVANVNSFGDTTSYTYDTGGFLRTIVDPNGARTTLGHDARGNEVSHTTCQNLAGGVCSTSYSTYYLNPSSPTDPRNDQLLTTRDARSASSSDDTYKTTYTYNAAGQPDTVTGPAVTGFPGGRTTTTVYTDASTPADGGGYAPPGLVKSVTTAGGAVQAFTYYANGDPATATDPRGQVVRFAYDGLGRVVSATSVSDSYPAGLVTAYTYDLMGREVTETAPPQTDAVTGAVHTARTSTIYDVDSNTVSETVTDLTGGDAPRTTSSTFDAANRVATATNERGKTTTFGYNTFGDKVSETAPDGAVTVTGYDIAGRLTSTTLKDYTGDPNAPVSATDLVTESRAYDPAGRVASVTDSMGWTTAFTYTDNGLLVAATRKDPSTDASFVQEDNRYDSAGNLIEKTTDGGASRTTITVDAETRQSAVLVDPGGLDRKTSYIFDADDRIVSATLSSGAASETTDATYNTAGDLASQTVHNGANLQTTTWTRDQRGLALSMSDPKGNLTNYLYDEAGHQVAEIAPSVAVEVAGGAPVTAHPVTRAGYNTFGEVVESQDANGNITTTGYDGAGNVTGQSSPPYTPPGGGAPIVATSTRAYNDIGQLVDEADPLGNHTTYLYDQLGDLSRVSAPGGAVTKFSHDTNGDQLAVISPTGARSEATYDYLGREKTTTDIVRNPAAAHTSTYSYGFGGWLASATTPAGVVTGYNYNAAGETTAVEDGAHQTTAYAYDLAGRPTVATRPGGTKTVQAYDQAGNLTSTTEQDIDGQVLRSVNATYDAANSQTSATDGRGNTTTYTVDATGALISQTEPVASGSTIVSSFGYDAAGNRTRFTDGRGNVFTSTFNTWNLPESQIEPSTPAYPAIADRTYTASYDAAGRVVRTDAPGGVSRARSYDARGNLTGETGSGAEAATVARSFAYDTGDRMTSASAPGTDDTFTWDDRGLLTSTAGASGAASFAYDGDGDMTSRTDAAGTSTYGYDAAGRLSTLVDASTATTQTLGYDPDSQLASIGYGPGKASRTYSYDDLHRLISDTLTAPGGGIETRIAYGYDAADNLTSKTTTGLAGAAVNTYTYDKANRLTSWNNGAATTAYAYDASGNRTGLGAKTLTYDARNRLSGDGTSTFTYTARGTLATTTTGGTSAASTFDAFDQMITDAASTYTYDGLGRVLTHATGGSPTPFAYTGLGNELASDGAAAYSRDPDGALVALASGGSTSLVMRDAHDDVVGQFTAAGTALGASTAYDPLGKVTAQTGTVLGRLGYQSGWTDPATAKVNMYSRSYDPGLGVFDSRDAARISPTPASAQANAYAYIGGNPFAGTDPLGYCLGPFCKIANAVGNAVSGAVSAFVDTVQTVAQKVVTVVKDTTKAVGKVVKNTTKTVVKVVKDAGKKTAEVAQAARARLAAAAKALEAKLAAEARALKKAIKAAKRAAKKKAAALARAVAKKAEKAARALKAKAAKVAKVAKAAKDHTVRLARAAEDKAKRATAAAAKFVDKHKASIAGVVTAIAVFSGCAAATAAVTGGTSVIACGAAANAAGNEVSYLVSHPHDASLSGALGTAVEGAVVGAATAGAGLAAGKAFTAAKTTVTNRVGGKLDDVLDAACKTAGAMSFAGATPVLLADGSHKPIAEVKVGDQVLATDPETGQQAAKTVLQVFVHQDTLTDLLLDGGAITTTEDHPFWSVTDHRFEKAEELSNGEQLLTPDGRTLTVTGLDPATARVATAYNLSVDNIHTYYVMPGATGGATTGPAVLVHNTGGCPIAANTTSQGVKRTNPSDWRALRDSWDDAGYDILSPDNLKAIAGGRTPRVDDVWVKWFPGDASLLGQRIPMHHVGGSRLTVPLPASRHVDAHMPGGFRYNPGGPGATG